MAGAVSISQVPSPSILNKSDGASKVGFKESRKVSQRLLETISIMDYDGVDNTGTNSNDSVLEQIKTDYPNGVEITFPTGTYAIADVELIRHLKFVGRGNVTIKKHGSAGASSRGIFYLTDLLESYISFDNITFDMNGEGALDYGVAGKIANEYSAQTIPYVYATGGSNILNAALYAVRSGHVYFKNCRFINSGENGITYRNCDHLYIDDCEFYNIANAGIEVNVVADGDDGGSGAVCSFEHYHINNSYFHYIQDNGLGTSNACGVLIGGGRASQAVRHVYTEGCRYYRCVRDFHIEFNNNSYVDIFKVDVLSNECGQGSLAGVGVRNGQFTGRIYRPGTAGSGGLADTYSPDTWTATTAHTVNDRVLRSTGRGSEGSVGRYFLCTTAGTTGASEPTWDTTPGNTTSDGTVVWTCYAYVPLYPSVYGVSLSTDVENVKVDVVVVDDRGEAMEKAQTADYVSGDKTITFSDVSLINGGSGFDSSYVGRSFAGKGALQVTGAVALNTYITAVNSSSSIEVETAPQITSSGNWFVVGGCCRSPLRMVGGKSADFVNCRISGCGIDSGLENETLADPAAALNLSNPQRTVRVINCLLESAESTEGDNPIGFQISSTFDGKLISDGVDAIGFTENFKNFNVQKTNTRNKNNKFSAQIATPSATVDTYGSMLKLLPRRNEFGIPQIAIEYENISSESLTVEVICYLTDDESSTNTYELPSVGSNTTNNLTLAQLAQVIEDNGKNHGMGFRVKSSKASSTAQIKVTLFADEF